MTEAPFTNTNSFALDFYLLAFQDKNHFKSSLPYITNKQDNNIFYDLHQMVQLGKKCFLCHLMSFIVQTNIFPLDQFIVKFPKIIKLYGSRPFMQHLLSIYMHIYTYRHRGASIWLFGYIRWILSSSCQSL